MSHVENIKYIRENTGYGVDSIIRALDTCDNDVEVALEYLRIKGLALAIRCTEFEWAYSSVYGKLPEKK